MMSGRKGAARFPLFVRGSVRAKALIFDLQTQGEYPPRPRGIRANASDSILLSAPLRKTPDR